MANSEYRFIEFKNHRSYKDLVQVLNRVDGSPVGIIRLNEDGELTINSQQNSLTFKKAIKVLNIYKGLSHGK